MSTTWDDTVAELRAAEAELAAMVAWQEDAQHITGRGTSTNRYAEVVVDAGGRPLRIDVTDSACWAGAQAVAEAILDANRAACANLARQMARSLTERYGVNAPVTQTVLGQLSQTYGLRLQDEEEER